MDLIQSLRIDVYCPCGQVYPAKPELIGQQVQCGRCGNWFLAMADSRPPVNPQQNSPVPGADASPRHVSTAHRWLTPTRIRQIIVVGAGLLLLVIIAAFLFVPAILAVFVKIMYDAETDLAWTAPPASWKTYTSEAGNYSIELPGVPKDVFNSERTAFGPIRFQGVALKVPNGTFLVGYEELPEGVDTLRFYPKPSRALESRYLDLSNHRAGIEPNELILGSGVRGNTERKNGSIIQRDSVGIGTRIYRVTWIGRPGKNPDRDVQRFFDSFRLLGPTGDQGPVKALSEFTEDQRKEMYLAFVRGKQFETSVHWAKWRIANSFNISLNDLDQVLREGKSKGWY